MPLVPAECINLRFRDQSVTSSPDLVDSSSPIQQEADRLMFLRKWLVQGYSFPWDVAGDTLRDIVSSSSSFTIHSPDENTVANGAADAQQQQSLSPKQQQVGGGGHFGYVPNVVQDTFNVEDGDGSLFLLWASSCLSDLLLERYCLFFNSGERRRWMRESSSSSTVGSGDGSVVGGSSRGPHQHCDPQSITTTITPPLVSYFKELCGCPSCTNLETPTATPKMMNCCLACGSPEHGVFDLDTEGREQCPARPHAEYLFHQARKYSLRMNSIIVKMCKKPEPHEEPTTNCIPIDRICSAAVQDVTRIHHMRRRGSINGNTAAGGGGGGSSRGGSPANSRNSRAVGGSFPPVCSPEVQSRLVGRVRFIRQRLAANRVSSATVSEQSDLQQDFLGLCMSRLGSLPSLSLLSANELFVQYTEKQVGSPTLTTTATTSAEIEPQTPSSTPAPMFPTSAVDDTRYDIEPLLLTKYPHNWRACLAHNCPIVHHGPLIGDSTDTSCCHRRPPVPSPKSLCSSSSSSHSVCLFRHECAFCDEEDHGWSTCPKIADNPALRVALHCLYINEEVQPSTSMTNASTTMGMLDSSNNLYTSSHDLSVQVSVEGGSWVSSADAALVYVTDAVIEAASCFTTIQSPFSVGSSNSCSSPAFPRYATGATNTSMTSRDENNNAAVPASDSSTRSNNLPVRNASYESLDRSVLRSRVVHNEDSSTNIGEEDRSRPQSPVMGTTSSDNGKLQQQPQQQPAVEEETPPPPSPIINTASIDTKLYSEIQKYCLIVRECRGDYHSRLVDEVAYMLPYGGGEFARYLYRWVSNNLKKCSADDERRTWPFRELISTSLSNSLAFNSPEESKPSTATPTTSSVACPSWWWCRLYCRHTCVNGITSNSCEGCQHHHSLPIITATTTTVVNNNKPLTPPANQCLRCGSRTHGWFSPYCRPLAILQQQLAMLKISNLKDLDFIEASTPVDVVAGGDSDKLTDSDYNDDSDDDDDFSDEDGDEDNTPHLTEDDDYSASKEIFDESSGQQTDTSPSRRGSEEEEDSDIYRHYQQDENTSMASIDENDEEEDGVGEGEDDVVGTAVVGEEEEEEEDVLAHADSSGNYEEEVIDKMCEGAASTKAQKKMLKGGRRVKFS